jgi:methyl-accepting chemotaxis protein
MMKNRSIKNYLINPGFQLRIILYFSVIAFSSTAAVILIFYKKFAAVRSLLFENSNISLPLQLAVDGVMFDFIKLSLFSMLFMSVGVCVVGILVTHRIAGPMYAILAYIEDLKKGNYDSKRVLRSYDELAPIMDSLKEFVSQLPKKN